MFPASYKGAYEISGLGIEGCVHMPGFKQYADLPAFYGLSHAVILPSISETWGLALNEAMASGLPVLVSTCCGCALDLVRDGVNGYTFDPYDVEGLAQLMLRVEGMDDTKRQELGANGKKIISNWGPKRFASGLKAAADKALQIGPIKPTLVQRAVLQLLLLR